MMLRLDVAVMKIMGKIFQFYDAENWRLLDFGDIGISVIAININRNSYKVDTEKPTSWIHFWNSVNDSNYMVIVNSLAITVKNVTAASGEAL